MFPAHQHALLNRKNIRRALPTGQRLAVKEVDESHLVFLLVRLGNADFQLAVDELDAPARARRNGLFAVGGFKQVHRQRARAVGRDN